MSYDEPLRLPVAAIPDGCRDWTAGRAGVWSAALPPRWSFLGVRRSVAAALSTFALCAGAWAAMLGGLWPFVAAGFAVYVLWVLARPELVWAGAPALLLALALEARSLPWVVTAVVAFVVVVTWAAVAVRLRARSGQLERALEAAGDTTARTPDADAVLRRGRFLLPVGLTVLGLGVLTGATAGLWGTPDDQRGSWVVAIYLAGLAVTALASAWLGRHRALALRRAPAPVLRVLVRDDAQGTTEVYAADDLAAVRPLFTVDLTSYDGEEPDEDDDEDDADGEAGDEELERLLDAVDDDTPGPVREAVLYGAPFDGAELVVVSADEDPDQPPLTEWSTGPVRPLSPSAGMRRAAKEKAREEQSRQLEEQARELVVDRPPVPVRRWRAGWLDWLAAALLVLWGAWFVGLWLSESGAPLWKLALLGVLGLYGVVRVPMKLAWRITADRSGLWVTGLRGPRHVPWDDFRSVRRQSFELKLRWRGDNWSVAAPRWAWFERRQGLVHPYDALAAELTAMRTDPALRPTGESTAPERGRPLWPLVLVLGVVWAAVLVVWG
ncbi:hypothetical protein FHS35_002638 [Streptomyces umbrinus]|uniref:hypothetical protein n=1 Tax=Streptomyces umbrinus TaxID=67370 RepID=UPI00167D95D9|nr:hypothetical protein [Streptomyces umbrinus]MCR3725790.1 hypothetical protein [Streptomyces umbrinus]GHH49253.1 hypothetical protein GCM10018775_44640 [Streptomyces umbrinus]